MSPGESRACWSDNASGHWTADHYDATVEAASADASHFDEVHAVGDRVRRPRTPVIDRFTVDLQNVSVDRPNKQVIGIGAAWAVVRVKAGDLAAFLEQQSWTYQPTVQLLPPDGVVISGSLKVPGLGLATTSHGTFRGRLIPNGSQLQVAVDALAVGDREAPALLRGLVATAINPLFDLSAYAVPSTIDRVSVQDDAIVLEASGSHLQVTPRRSP